MTENNQKIAIVTGGASGIGLAIVEAFIQTNIFTIIIGRDENKLADAKDQFGDKCATISFDLTDLKSIPQLIADITEEFGNIDILVNNAGINQKKIFTEVTDEDFQRVMLTN